MPGLATAEAPGVLSWGGLETGQTVDDSDTPSHPTPPPPAHRLACYTCLIWLPVGTEHPPSQAGRWLPCCAVLSSGPLHCAEGGNFPLSSLAEGLGVLRTEEVFGDVLTLHQGSDVDLPPPPVEPRRSLGGMLEAERGTRRSGIFSLSAQGPQSRQGFGNPMDRSCFLPSYTLPTALARVKWTAVESRQYGQGKNLVSFEESHEG